MITVEHAQYIPGVCNIGPEERRARRMVGWLGLVITVVAWVLLAYLGLALMWYLVIFLSASLSASGFIQDRMHFCANFGMRHVFNFGPEVGDTDAVMQREFWAADRRKAIRILVYSLLWGVLTTGAAILLRRFF